MAISLCILRKFKFTPGGGTGIYPYPKAWSPYNRGAGIVLTGLGLTADASSPSYVLGTPLLAINPGQQKFFEIIINSFTNGCAVGIGQIGGPYGVDVGDDALTWVYSTFLTVTQKRHNAVYATYGTLFAPGDVIGIYCDYTGSGGTTLSLKYFYNGVGQGSAYTGLTGTFYPCVGSIVGNSFSLTGNFVGPTVVPAFTIPAGSSFF